MTTLYLFECYRMCCFKCKEVLTVVDSWQWTECNIPHFVMVTDSIAWSVLLNWFSYVTPNLLNVGSMLLLLLLLKMAMMTNRWRWWWQWWLFILFVDDELRIFSFVGNYICNFGENEENDCFRFWPWWLK